MHIGIVCYPSVGGSGVVATELGKELAERGHVIHFFSSDVPFRLRSFHANIHFHQVETPTYFLFKEPPYVLALANKIFEVNRLVGLDVVHAHYAVPHATAAYLAREMSGRAFQVVTTLHGTDITLMGQEPGYAASIAFAIEQSDAVTAVSSFLRQLTYDTLPVTSEIAAIHNFLNCHVWKPQQVPNLRDQLAGRHERIVAHLSNLRPVKRVDRVIQIFAGICQETPARLLLIGDGPECAKAFAVARAAGVLDQVHFLGNQEEVIPLLTLADLLLLPSETESFGLAALEAMACATPVVASRVGGLPEVVEEGVSGFLRPPEDVAGMIQASLTILQDNGLRLEMGHSARSRVMQVFCAERIVPQYEAVYHRAVQVRT